MRRQFPQESYCNIITNTNLQHRFPVHRPGLPRHQEPHVLIRIRSFRG